MQTSSLALPATVQAAEGAETFYRQIMETLNAESVPFLIGGAYGLSCFTGIRRHTKDLDIFIRRADYSRFVAALAKAGYQTELTYPHWLAKVHCDGEFIDVIFSSGNGIAEVDDAWFEHAVQAEMLGSQVSICPLEETIWSKAFIMERERYDGADIVHLLRSSGAQINWRRMLDRFGEHWRVLFSHLVLFGFVYAAHRDLVPAWVMEELTQRLLQETHAPPPAEQVCSGPLLSREQYLVDIQQWGYQDARVAPHGNMSPLDTASWTDAISDKH